MWFINQCVDKPNPFQDLLIFICIVLSLTDLVLLFIVVLLTIHQIQKETVTVVELADQVDSKSTEIISREGSSPSGDTGEEA